MAPDTPDSPVLRAIFARASTPMVRDDLPPREAIECILTAAVQAPNHYKTEPWRFVVLAGAAREALGDVMAEALRRELPVPDAPESLPLIERERRKPLRAPVVIAVGVAPAERAKVVPTEELAAVAAAVQNMLLAAEALGLASMWRTGAPAYNALVKEFLGLPPDGDVVAFVYLGYAAAQAERRVRTETRARWLGWPD